MELYQRIRRRREELKMSQDELALRVGYKSRSTIAKIEAGTNDISQSKIKKFADALNVTPGYLMGLGNEENEENLKVRDLGDNDIITLAAHRSGHEGALSKEDMERVKLAIQIALAKNNK